MATAPSAQTQRNKLYPPLCCPRTPFFFTHLSLVPSFALPPTPSPPPPPSTCTSIHSAPSSQLSADFVATGFIPVVLLPVMRWMCTWDSMRTSLHVDLAANDAQTVEGLLCSKFGSSTGLRFMERYKKMSTQWDQTQTRRARFPRSLPPLCPRVETVVVLAEWWKRGV